MKKILETERLLLRELDLSDAAFISELVNTPKWLQHIGDRNIHTMQDAEQYLINGPMQSYTANGFGLWGMTLKDREVLIGMCGLIRRDYLPHTDIGYALLPQFENKGYAHEAALATAKYAGEVLRLKELLAIVEPEHERSVHLLTKIGMAQQEMITLPGETKELLLMHMML